MTPSTGRAGGSSIHRALISRLVFAGVCTSLLLAALVLFVQFGSINDRVLEQVAISTERLRWAVIENLDSPGLGDHARIQRLLDRGMSGRARPSEGHFVIVRVLDPAFREVAGKTDPSFAHLGEVARAVAAGVDQAALEKRGRWSRGMRVSGETVIHIGYELRDSGNRRAGFIEGVYAISPAFLHRARMAALTTGLVAAGIVLLTTLILYPVINRLLRRVSNLSADLLHANLEILNVLGSAVAKRDNDTDAHNFRVTIYAVRIAEEMGLGEGEIQTLIKGAFLHDVGKIGISDAILLKPSDLTPEEYEEMKRHVRHGLDIVKRSGWLREAALVVGSHHEKYDGTGYLERIGREEIPRVARVFTIADVFDALTSKRPYKEAFGFAKAMEIMEQGRGTHFDPEILDAFARIAPSLYETWANRTDAGLRAELAAIGAPYFDRTLIDRIVSLRARARRRESRG